MNTAKLFSCRVLTGIAAAGAALTFASGASAQAPLPFYAFVVSNQTSSLGDPVFNVFDPLTFSSVQVNEGFADGTSQTFSFQDAYGDAPGTVTAVDTVAAGLQNLTNDPLAGYLSPTHGALTSAVLTGTLSFPGITPDGTGILQTDILNPDGTTYTQPILTNFSADLFAPASGGVAVGTFSLMNLGSGLGTSVTIDAAPVPECSTTVSLGLLLILGLGGAAVARRRSAANSL